MSNPNGDRGRRWEKAITDFLRLLLGRQAVIKPRQEGYIDIGDVHVSPFVLQAKDEKAHNFSGYINDAEKQAAAAGEDYGVAVVKRRNYGTGKGYVVMTLRTFALVVMRLRRAEEYLLRANPDLFDKHVSMTQNEKEQNP